MILIIITIVNSDDDSNNNNNNDSNDNDRITTTIMTMIVIIIAAGSQKTSEQQALFAGLSNCTITGRLVRIAATAVAAQTGANSIAFPGFCVNFNYTRVLVGSKSSLPQS